MAKNKPVRKCKLCGRELPMTFEHVPPEAAFNGSSVKKYDGEESVKMLIGEDGRRPWDLEGLKYTVEQRGGGDYYLCEECNSNTGSWYVSEYVALAKTFSYILQTEQPPVGSNCGFRLYDICPHNILKAAMVMFCDINESCFGDEELREYLLTKESRNFNRKKYSVYLNIVCGSMRRINPLSCVYTAEWGTILLSDIQSYPIGLSLFINKPDEYEPVGFRIDHFAECAVGERCNMDFCDVPIVEIASQQPLEFRTKAEMEADILAYEQQKRN